MSPDPIRLLDASVIAGIAAGEVVERPASVIKELVENALDAGARRVAVEYDDGARTRIVVLDDGCGIAESDLDLALTRHATSKIRTLDDLARVETYGFRGEALASVAAVSNIDIVSRASGAEGGMRASVRGGRLIERAPAGMSGGTRIEVHDLFESVPARRKFLKSAAHEAALVVDTVRRFALAHSGVHLKLTHNGRMVLDLPAVSGVAERARQVLGREAGHSLVELDAKFCGLTATGFLSTPGVSFGSARRVSVYVNRRWVRDRLLFRAVMEGYHTFLLKGRYPAAAVFLEADPAAVDVNVHPAKLEVRFAEGEAVARFLAEAVRASLRETASPLGRWGVPREERLAREARMAEGQRPWPRRYPTSDEGDAGVATATPGERSRDADVAAERIAEGTAAASGIEETASDRVPGGYATVTSIVAGSALPQSARADSAMRGPTHDSSERPLPGYRPAAPPAAPRHGITGEQTALDYVAATRGLLGGLEVIGQIFDGYIACQADGELVLVDQHAAHERVLFERLIERYEKHAVERQPLLLPVTVSVGADGVEAAEAARDELLAFGWEIDAFGIEEVIVRAMPALVAGADPAALAEAAIADLCQLGTAAGARKLAERVMATVACHAAVRVGQRMDRARATTFLRDVATVELRASCPHGRPVARSLTRAQIERMFGR